LCEKTAAGGVINTKLQPIYDRVRSRRRVRSRGGFGAEKGSEQWRVRGKEGFAAEEGSE